MSTHVRCSKCLSLVCDKTELVVHNRKYHPEVDRPYKCEGCDLRFSSLYLLQIHMISHLQRRRTLTTHFEDKTTKPYTEPIFRPEPPVPLREDTEEIY